MGFRFILLSDDNFYPVTMEDLRLAERQGNTARIESLQEIRRERFELMDLLAKLPDDLVFYTQITMEAAEDPEFLKAMNRARIRGALVGVESVTPEGLKAIFKDFNYAGDKLVTRLKEFRKHGVHILGLVHLRSADRQGGHVRGDGRARAEGRHRVRAVHHADAVSRHGRLRQVGREDGVGSDAHRRSSADAVLADPARAASEGVHAASDRCRPSRFGAARSRRGIASTAFLPSGSGRASSSRFAGGCCSSMMSKLYRQMYANTGIATDSARVSRSAQLGALAGTPARKLFVASPMPDLQVPN